MSQASACIVVPTCGWVSTLLLFYTPIREGRKYGRTVRKIMQLQHLPVWTYFSKSVHFLDYFLSVAIAVIVWAASEVYEN